MERLLEIFCVRVEGLISWALSVSTYYPAISTGDKLTGCTASYADFVVAGIIHCMKTVDEEAYKKIISLDPALEPLYKACGKWLERDDH